MGLIDSMEREQTPIINSNTATVIVNVIIIDIIAIHNIKICDQPPIVRIINQ